MGLFGGGNSKSTTTNEDITFNNVDYGGGGASGQNFNIANKGDGNSFTMTDHGAVNKSLDFAQSSLDKALGLAMSTSNNNAQLAQMASRTDNEKSGDTTSKLMLVGLGFSTLLLFAVANKKG